MNGILRETSERDPREARDWDALKAFVGFTEADAQVLVALEPIVAPHLGGIARSLKESLGACEITACSVPFEADALSALVADWLRRIFAGDYGPEYHALQRRIGRAHARAGVPERFVVAAMSLLRRELLDIVWPRLSGEGRRLAVHAIDRLLDLDGAVMSAAFMEAHEEHRLRTLQAVIVENLPVTVLCIDGQGRVTAATRPGARLFGGAAGIGSHYLEFLPPELVEEADLPTQFGRSLATGREITIPRVGLGEGPEARVFRFTLVPLDHDLARLLLHIEELTDVVHAEARLQQAEGLARIGSLAANVAHEIRNPLAAISATLQVIATSLESGDRRGAILTRVQDQVTRLDRLVNDLLGYARPAHARVREIDPVALAREAVCQSGVRAEVVAQVEVRVFADPHQTVQVLVNLLQNAEESAGPGGRVQVEVGPGGEIVVADDGPGVSAEALARLFEPFFTTRSRGTGLGLAISRKLAEAMGGRLELLPPSLTPLGRGPGARFRLSLPLSDSPVRASPPGTGARTA